MATRIGLAGLLQDRMGSVALPEEITLVCPRCTEPVADKGNCIVDLRIIADCTSKSGYRVRLQVDCRTCGCTDEEPAIQ